MEGELHARSAGWAVAAAPLKSSPTLLRCSCILQDPKTQAELLDYAKQGCSVFQASCCQNDGIAGVCNLKHRGSLEQLGAVVDARAWG